MARKKPRDIDGQPRTRNWVAVAAHDRSSAGAHGGTARQNNKRERASSRRDLQQAAGER